MSTTTRVKVRMDKSSRKRKATEVDNGRPSSPTTSVPTAQEMISTQRLGSTNGKRATSSPSPTSEHDNASESDEASQQRPSKKRKSSIDEIEVDITAPEPPSKKALRRLKKGKPLPPSKSGANSSPEPEERTEKPEVEKRSEHGIWIGNLPWTVAQPDLRQFFTDNSDITDEIITRIHMPSPEDGKPANKVEDKRFRKKQHNKGFAYIDFSTAQAVEQAVELSEQLLFGRRVLIKNHKSFEGRPQKSKGESRSEGKEPSKKIFVGNLRFDTTEDSLKEHFERCGPIETVFLATFEDSGKCKGYGWVTFEDIEAAESAVRGHVLVKQEETDDEDSNEDSDAASREDDTVTKSEPKKVAMKKLWVDKIFGRPIRREFSEAPQVRYKKRYGKDGTKVKSGGDETGTSEETASHGTPMKYDMPHTTARLTGGIVKSQGKKVVF